MNITRDEENNRTIYTELNTKQDIREANLHSYIEECKRMYLINEDNEEFRRLMIWEDINQASAKDWDDFWKAVKLNNVQFRRTAKREQRKIINIFDEFPKDVLIELYKDKDVVCITEYFLDAISNAKYDGGKLIDEDNLLSDKFYNHLSLTNASTALQNRQFRSDKERIRLIRKRDACLALENILDTKYYEPEYFENNLTYYFIFDFLQYASYEAMIKLLRLNDEIKTEMNRIVICQFDNKTGEFISYFNSRKECIEKTFISKGELSKVLSGKKRCSKGYRFVEKRYKEIKHLIKENI